MHTRAEKAYRVPWEYAISLLLNEGLDRVFPPLTDPEGYVRALRKRTLYP
jgi:hypothetical protein